MKKSEIDTEITDLIVQTLQDHKEQYILGSWESYVNRRRRKKRMLFFFTSTGIAATFLVGLLGFRLLFHDSTDVILNNSNEAQINITTAKPAAKNFIETINNPLIAQAKDTKADKSTEDNISMEEVASPSSAIALNRDERIGDRVAEISLLKGLPFRINNHPVQTAYLIRKNPFSQSELKTLLKENSNIIVAYEDIDNTASTRPHKLKLGVGISPGVTSTASASSYNYSGGFNAEIDLTRNLSLSAGIQIEHQNIVNRNTDNPTWLPEGESRAMLTALDLPFNLKFEFIDRQSSSFYISGGISSIAWLEEKYVNTSYSQKVVMNVRNLSGEAYVSYDIENVKNIETRTIDPLTSFNFAGRLNLMIGYEKKISSKLSLYLEPFVKIPVSEKTAEELEYTISGVSCRLSF